MKKIASFISLAALVLLITAPCLFYAERLTLEQNKLLMLVATISWFAAASVWIGKDKEKSQ